MKERLELGLAMSFALPLLHLVVSPLAFELGTGSRVTATVNVANGKRPRGCLGLLGSWSKP